MGVFSPSKLKNIYVDGGCLKKIMCNSKQIWSGSVAITFVENGVSTTVKYDKGATVSRATAPSGMSFVGWSADPSGADPVKTFVATQDATYYRVVKYADTTLRSTDGIGSSGDYPDNVINNGILSGISIDTSKYSGFTVTYTLSMEVAYKDHHASLYVTAGGTTTHIRTQTNGKSGYVYPTVTVNFTQVSGNTSLKFSCSVGPNRSVGYWWIQSGSTYNLQGRTVVG